MKTMTHTKPIKKKWLEIEASVRERGHAQGEGGHNRMFASVRGTRGPAIVYENCISP